MIADVIVDVKVKNVNRPFSYHIPKHLEDMIEPGMRVVVPFGARRILGYVVNIREDEPVDFELKDIFETSDLIPSLTPELLQLAKQMAEDTASFYISCIQVMLPVAIKAKYRKLLVPNTEDLPLDLKPYFVSKRPVDVEDVRQEDLSRMKQAINDGLIELIYEVKDRASIQYDRYIRLIDDDPTKLRRAKKQQLVVDYLKTKDRPILKNEIIETLAITPTVIQRLIDKGLVEEVAVERYRTPYEGIKQIEDKHILTPEQQKAYDTVRERIEHQEPATFLLHGVTGSGKTEVYLHLIEAVIEQGKEAIVLVPEISLTPQIVNQFKRRFGDEVAVMHSGLSIGEKYDEWRKIRNGQVKIAVGARSAIFAPFTNLGIIIIDEEHESTYKQEDMPKYHAVEVAKRRQEYHQCVLLLGSATPSLESYARAVRGVYELLEMNLRATQTALPQTHIVDMTVEAKKGNLSIISELLYASIVDRLEKDEQVILLLNRRGYNNFMLCRSCGGTVMCQNCDISLTYHKRSGKLKCHYCGFESRPPKHCPNCGSEHISGFGYGTEKVEEELKYLFPTTNILRMDVDTTSRKGAHEAILSQFQAKEAHILLGTQMIAKGLDFEDVTLVGVLMADTSLKLPDFRASEKTFQLITQVAGRAGRHKDHGDVIIQTYNPNHYAIQAASRQNYKAFFNQEMTLRRLGRYVPYYFMCQIVISSDTMSESYRQGERIRRFLQKELSEEAILLGPVIPSVGRIKNKYYTQLIVKYKKESNLKRALEQVLVTYNSQAVNVTIDMYPNFLV